MRHAFHLVILLWLAIRAGAPVLDVTGVTVSMPVAVNQPATVTVTGTNPCGAVQVDFGDGTVITYPISQLPYAVAPHVWTSTGSKIVTATGMGNCSGTASTTVTVQSGAGGSLAQLCQSVDCAGVVSALMPKITAVLTVSEAGGVGAIAGKNFGTSPGHVYVKMKDWKGTEHWSMLPTDKWSPTVIHFRWQDNVDGVVDQEAYLRVTTAANAKSNDWPVQFRATLDDVMLPIGDVTVISCGTDSNHDQCNYWWDADDSYASYIQTPNGSIAGRHHNVWAAIGDDAGTDVFGVPALKNTWRMSGLQKLAWETEGATLSEPYKFGFDPIGSGGTISLKWTVTPDDHVWYDIAVWIVGPRGVPYK